MRRELLVVCDARSHDRPVPVDLFFWREGFLDDWTGEEVPAGWSWENGRKMGGVGRLDYDTGIREVMHRETHQTVYVFEGRNKVSLDCRKCGLHLPMRWDRWEAMLTRLSDAGETSASLPALVAILTK